eukprot:1138415-Pelagomonas_calceolata.AAC.1
MEATLVVEPWDRSNLTRKVPLSHTARQLIIREGFESIFFTYCDDTLKVGGCAEVVCPFEQMPQNWGLRQIQGTKTDLPKFS